MIRLKNVVKAYPAKAEANGAVIRALDNISLEVAPGEWLAMEREHRALDLCRGRGLVRPDWRGGLLRQDRACRF